MAVSLDLNQSKVPVSTILQIYQYNMFNLNYVTVHKQIKKKNFIFNFNSTSSVV